MIRTIVAFDDTDESLGHFFSECLDDLRSFSAQTWPLTYITSNTLNEANIAMQVPIDRGFAFLAYSHGSESALLASGVTPYISESINIALFKNAFFYTCSCYAGKILGKLLIDNNCLSFIGYNEKFEIWNYNRKPFVECANFGYKSFAEGYTVTEVVTRMKEKYDTEIDGYKNDFFGAAILLSNRNALIAHGNGDLTIQNLIEIR